jgi:hypothetical protein
VLVLTIPALPAAAAPRPAACVHRAAFVADVTVPDNTVQPRGAAVKKVWRLRNTGLAPEAGD